MSERISIIQDRKRLLEYMDIMYPAPVKTKLLFESCVYVNPDYEPACFRKDIHYLIDKGWIEFVDEKLGGFRDFREKVLHLTASGKEIAERTREDPALEI